MSVGRVIADGLDLWDRMLTPRVRHAVGTWGLAVVFVMISIERTLSAVRLGYVAVDLKIYRAAALAALQGGDPWQAGAEGLTFAAPPPSLLPYLPAAVVPEPIAIALYAGLSIAAALLVLRTSRLPLWWLLYPPLAECLVVLNSNIFVLALLLIGGRWAFGSMVFKIYAAIPLFFQRQWMAIALGTVVCATSLPLLATFLTDRDVIADALDLQSSGGLSAWGSWVMVPTLAALVILRKHGAEWLAVPALWPYTQLHYAVLALPVAARSPMTAFLLCFAVLWFPPLAVILLALEVVAQRLAAPYRSGMTNTAPSASS